MIQIVKEFQEFAFNIDHFIDKSNFKTKYFIEILELSRPTFYRKMREKAFTINEIGKLSEILFPKELYKYQLEKELSFARKEIVEGKIVSSEDAKILMRKQIENL